MRIVASDAPGNPPSNVLTGSREGTSFEVDNTPPVITASVDPQHKGRIRATARDDSPLRKLEVSIDAGRWEEVLPTDGIADSPQEEYEITLPPAVVAGPRVAILRAVRHPRQRRHGARRRPVGERAQMEVLLVRAGALGDLLLLRRSVSALQAAGHTVSPAGARLRPRPRR